MTDVTTLNDLPTPASTDFVLTWRGIVPYRLALGQLLFKDASGNVGIGTTTINARFSLGALANNKVLALFDDGANQYGFGIAPSQLLMYAANGANILFGTYNRATNTFTEGARFDPNRKFLLGTSTLSAASVSGIATLATDVMSTGSTAGYFWENRAGGVTTNTNWGGWYQTGGSTFLYNGAANIASINMSSGAYAALSDATKKDRFADSDIGIDHVMRVTPTFYNLKDVDPEGTPRKLGFTVQDIEAAGIEEAVVKINDVDNDMTTDDVWLGLDPMPLIATLWLAVKQEKVRADALEARLALLEGANA